MVKQLVLVLYVIILHHLNAHALPMVHILLLLLAALSKSCHRIISGVDLGRRLGTQGVLLYFSEYLLDLPGFGLPNAVPAQKLLLDQRLVVFDPTIGAHCQVRVAFHFAHLD